MINLNKYKCLIFKYSLIKNCFKIVFYLIERKKNASNTKTEFVIIVNTVKKYFKTTIRFSEQVIAY